MPHLEGVKKQKRRAALSNSPDHQGASTQHSIPVYASGLMPVFEFDVKDFVKREVFLPSAPYSLIGVF